MRFTWSFVIKAVRSLPFLRITWWSNAPMGGWIPNTHLVLSVTPLAIHQWELLAQTGLTEHIKPMKLIKCKNIQQGIIILTDVCLVRVCGRWPLCALPTVAVFSGLRWNRRLTIPSRCWCNDMAVKCCEQAHNSRELFTKILGCILLWIKALDAHA